MIPNRADLPAPPKNGAAFRNSARWCWPPVAAKFADAIDAGWPGGSSGEFLRAKPTLRDLGLRRWIDCLRSALRLICFPNHVPYLNYTASSKPDGDLSDGSETLQLVAASHGLISCLRNGTIPISELNRQARFLFEELSTLMVLLLIVTHLQRGSVRHYANPGGRRRHPSGHFCPQGT